MQVAFGPSPATNGTRFYWSGIVERHTAFERAAQKMADTFGIQTLENLFFASIYAKQGQAQFDDYPLYRRALAIARERGKVREKR